MVCSGNTLVFTVHVLCFQVQRSRGGGLVYEYIEDSTPDNFWIGPDQVLCLSLYFRRVLVRYIAIQVQRLVQEGLW